MDSTESMECKRDPSDVMKSSRDKALVMQRKQRLQALVHKRKSNLSYLLKTHEGGIFWLNCILLSNDNILKYASTAPKHRTLTYYHLTASTSAILALSSGSATVRALLQLLEEWEYHFAGSATQSLKFVLAKNTSCMYPAPPTQINLSGNDENDLKVHSINKFDNNVVYEYLDTTHVPFELDYIEVLYSLFDSIGVLYSKFLSDECFK